MVGVRGADRGKCLQVARSWQVAGFVVAIAVSCSAVENSALATSGTWQTTVAPAQKTVAARRAGARKPPVEQAPPAEPAPTVEVAPTSPIPTLNPTGKSINMPVPFKDGTQTLGDLIVRINPDSSVSVQKVALAEKLKTLLDAKARTTFDAITETGGWIALADVQAAGLGVKFDSGMMELTFEATADQPPSEISR